MLLIKLFGFDLIWKVFWCFNFIWFDLFLIEIGLISIEKDSKSLVCLWSGLTIFVLGVFEVCVIAFWILDLEIPRIIFLFYMHCCCAACHSTDDVDISLVRRYDSIVITTRNVKIHDVISDIWCGVLYNTHDKHIWHTWYLVTIIYIFHILYNICSL